MKVSLLLILNTFTPCSSVSIVNFEHVIADWDKAYKHIEAEIQLANNYIPAISPSGKVSGKMCFRLKYPYS